MGNAPTASHSLTVRLTIQNQPVTIVLARAMGATLQLVTASTILAIVLGVLVALGIGDTLDLNSLTVAVLVAASLAIAELLLRLPRAAARQVPISILVVLAAVGASQDDSGWLRAVDTVIGAVIGVAVSFALPASRLVDAHQTLDRLADSLRDARLRSLRSGHITLCVTRERGLERSRDTLRIAVTDSGAGFDHVAELARAADPDCASRRGRGIAMLRALCEELTYTGTGNVAEVVYRLTPPAA